MIVIMGYSVFPGFTYLPEDAHVDLVLVEKGKRTLSLIHEGKPLKSYRISLGRNPVGPKRCIGDRKTPEGAYTIDWRNSESKYHLSLHISYPNSTDHQNANEIGCDPGGDIMIHGLPNGRWWIGRYHRIADWTKGCIAVTNWEIEEIWRAVSNGTKIEIRP
jgi:murein L,D-transpeptidase YafK